MINHRRQTQNLIVFTADKCDVFVMVVLIAFQNRNENLQYQLLRHRRVGLEIVGFEDFGVVVEHLAVIDVVINMTCRQDIFERTPADSADVLLPRKSSVKLFHNRNISPPPPHTLRKTQADTAAPA